MKTIIHHRRLSKKALTKVCFESEEHDFLYFLVFSKWMCCLKKIAFQFRLMTFILTVLWEFEEKYANSPWIGTFAKWTKELIWETGCQRTISPKKWKLRKVCKKYMCLLDRDWASLWKAGNNWLESRTLAPKMFAQANRAPTLSLHLPLAEKNNPATLSWINFCKVYFYTNIYHLTHFFLNMFTQTKKRQDYHYNCPSLKERSSYCYWK